MGDAEAEARTEKGAGGAGRPTAHPTGAALAAVAGGLVSGARAGQRGEPNNSGYLPAHPTGAAGAAPVRCSGKYPALFGSPLWPARAPLTRPPAAAAKAAPVGCAVRRPAPPAFCSVHASASASFIATTPCGAAPSPPSIGYSQLVSAVRRFSSPPPRPRLSSPGLDWDAVGAPRVLTTSGGPTSC